MGDLQVTLGWNTKIDSFYIYIYFIYYMYTYLYLYNSIYIHTYIYNILKQISIKWLGWFGALWLRTPPGGHLEINGNPRSQSHLPVTIGIDDPDEMVSFLAPACPGTFEHVFDGDLMETSPANICWSYQNAEIRELNISKLSLNTSVSLNIVWISLLLFVAASFL